MTTLYQKRDRSRSHDPLNQTTQVLTRDLYRYVLKGPNWTTLGPVLMLQLWLLQVHSLFCLDPHKYRSIQVKFCSVVLLPQDGKWAAAGKSQCICECVGVPLLTRRCRVKEQRSDWWWTNKLLFAIFVASGCARNLPTEKKEERKINWPDWSPNKGGGLYALMEG